MSTQVYNKFNLYKVAVILYFIVLANGEDENMEIINISEKELSTEDDAVVEVKTTTLEPKPKVLRHTEMFDRTIVMIEEEVFEGRFLISLLPSKTLIDKYSNGSTPPQPTD